MTRERLEEAINFLNPETGIQDVIKSARMTRKLLMEEGEKYTSSLGAWEDGLMEAAVATRCVLARGWKDGNTLVEVGSNEVLIQSAGSPYTVENHPYSDVVSWFDHFNDLDAVENVLITLGEELD